MQQRDYSKHKQIMLPLGLILLILGIIIMIFGTATMFGRFGSSFKESRNMSLT